MSIKPSIELDLGQEYTKLSAVSIIEIWLGNLWNVLILDS